MQSLEKIESAATLLRRVDAAFAMVLHAGPDAQLCHVMDMNIMMREQIGQALSILEAECDVESRCTERNAGVSVQTQPALAPAHGGAAVVSFRPSPRA